MQDTTLWCKRHGFDPWVRKILWRRKWQPTAAFLPGEFHRQRNLVGCSPWDLKSQLRLSNFTITTTTKCVSIYGTNWKRTDIWFEMRLSRVWSMGWLSVLMNFHFHLLPIPHKGSPSFLTGLAPYLFRSPLEAGYSWCPTEPFPRLCDFLMPCAQTGLRDSEHLGSPLGQWQER